ncbi:MAG: hypothetical protein AAF307_10380 [Pseudomonadota bacterium]
MTATADFIQKDIPVTEPVRMVDGTRMIARGIQRLLGAALALAAVGLWVAPGSSWDNDILLFKLILSLTAVFAGIGLMSASAKPRAPEVQIDTIRREVRLVRRMTGAAPVVLQSCRFDELAQAEFDGATVKLWDTEGVFLADVCPTDRNALSSLVSGLRDAGKID